MSYQSDYYAYRKSLEIRRGAPPFYSLIMAALWLADSRNAAKLRAVFPEVWDDLRARYDSPGGVLPSDPLSVQERVLSGENESAS